MCLRSIRLGDLIHLRINCSTSTMTCSFILCSEQLLLSVSLKSWCIVFKLQRNNTLLQYLNLIARKESKKMLHETKQSRRRTACHAELNSNCIVAGNKMLILAQN